MRLKLVPADPTATYGAKVVNENGEEVEDLVCVTYVHRAGSFPRLIVEVYGEPMYGGAVELEADGEITTVKPGDEVTT